MGRHLDLGLGDHNLRWHDLHVYRSSAHYESVLLPDRYDVLGGLCEDVGANVGAVQGREYELLGVLGDLGPVLVGDLERVLHQLALAELRHVGVGVQGHDPDAALDSRHNGLPQAVALQQGGKGAGVAGEDGDRWYAVHGPLHAELHALDDDLDRVGCGEGELGRGPVPRRCLLHASLYDKAFRQLVVLDADVVGDVHVGQIVVLVPEHDIQHDVVVRVVGCLVHGLHLGGGDGPGMHGDVVGRGAHVLPLEQDVDQVRARACLQDLEGPPGVPVRGRQFKRLGGATLVAQARRDQGLGRGRQVHPWHRLDHNRGLHACVDLGRDHGLEMFRQRKLKLDVKGLVGPSPPGRITDVKDVHSAPGGRELGLVRAVSVVHDLVRDDIRGVRHLVDLDCHPRGLSARLDLVAVRVVRQDVHHHELPQRGRLRNFRDDRVRPDVRRNHGGGRVLNLARVHLDPVIVEFYVIGARYVH